MVPHLYHSLEHILRQSPFGRCAQSFPIGVVPACSTKSSRCGFINHVGKRFLEKKMVGRYELSGRMKASLDSYLARGNYYEYILTARLVLSHGWMALETSGLWCRAFFVLKSVFEALTWNRKLIRRILFLRITKLLYYIRRVAANGTRTNALGLKAAWPMFARSLSRGSERRANSALLYCTFGEISRGWVSLVDDHFMSSSLLSSSQNEHALYKTTLQPSLKAILLGHFSAFYRVSWF